jgi:hypothetical protein
VACQLLHGDQLAGVGEKREFINRGQLTARVHLLGVGVKDTTRHEVGEQILTAQLGDISALVDEPPTTACPLFCTAAGPAGGLWSKATTG